MSAVLLEQPIENAMTLTEIESLPSHEIPPSMQFSTFTDGNMPKKGRTIHVIYDESYKEWELHHILPHRLETECGFRAECHFVSEATVDQVIERIPRSAIVFNYCDGSVNGTPVLAWKLANRFSRMIGAGPIFLQNTEKKSVINALLAAAGLPYCQSEVIRSLPELDHASLPARLEALGLPLFVKVEAGFDSQGLTERNVCPTVHDALVRVREMIIEHGPCVVQRFLSGREFTIPVAMGRAFRPIEKLLGDHKFYFSWMKNEKWRILDEFEPDGITQPLMELSARAYLACRGDSYGRVDIRQDATTGELFVLEVNSVCSININSFFDLGLAPYNITFADVVHHMVEAADAKVYAMKQAGALVLLDDDQPGPDSPSVASNLLHRSLADAN